MFAWESRNLIRSFIYTNVRDFHLLGAGTQWNNVIWPVLSPLMFADKNIRDAIPDELFAEPHTTETYFKVCNTYESSSTDFAGPAWSNFILETPGSHSNWDVRPSLYNLLKVEIEAGTEYGLCHFLALRVRKFLEQHDLDPLDEQSYDDLESLILDNLGVKRSDLDKIDPEEFNF